MKRIYFSSVLSCLIVFVAIFVLSIAPANAQGPEISIHYLGHCSFIILFDNGLYVLTDYGTSNAYGLSSPIYSIGSLKPDIMTFSHKHIDHYNPDRIPDSVRYILTLHDTLSLDGLTIRPVRTSEITLAEYSNSSFIFSYKGYTLIHLGDAQANIMNIDNEENQKYLREIFPQKIDMLLTTIEGLSQFIPQAETFIDFLKPKQIIPMHYWTHKYKEDFFDYLETKNQNEGKNYRIERRRGAKYAISIADTNVIPTKVISLEAAPFFDFTQPELWHNCLQLNDSAGNNNGRADAGETVRLVFNLNNSWNNASNVSVTLREDDPEVQVINATVNFGDIAMNQQASNKEMPFTFSVSSTAVAHFTKFYLDITADDNYASVDSFEIVIGTPTILLIDDDAGNSNEAFYTAVMIPEHWDVAQKGCPTVDVLQQYKSVVWFTGNDRQTSLTTEEQAVIATFLDHGGRLLICGQNIAFDLGGDGTVSDSLFLADYLHAQFVADSADVAAVLGIVGDPISSGMMMNLKRTPAGEGNKSAPDLINPVNPEELIFKYIPGMAGAGQKYENETTGARLIFLAFGIEKIIGPKASTPADFMAKVITWLTGTTPVANKKQPSFLPADYWLGQNFPNPFNPNTTIQYSLPQPGFVSLKIYNLIGEEMATLVSKKQAAGRYQVKFNGKQFPSGVYFYRLQAGNFSATKKFVLLQ